jgi:hypothetical protein
MSEKIKVVIDRAKWRTGGSSRHSTGAGDTMLENDGGYMCCLGFCIKALGDTYQTMGYSHPADLQVLLPGLTQLPDDYDDYVDFHPEVENTSLAGAAIEINDSGYESASTKERRLLELFKDSVYELQFVGEYNARQEDQSGD